MVVPHLLFISFIESIKVKQRKRFFFDNLPTTILMKTSRIELAIDIVVHRVTLKTT